MMYTSIFLTVGRAVSGPPVSAQPACCKILAGGANSEFRSLKGQRTVPGALSFAGLLWCRSQAYCVRPSSLTPPWKTAFLPPESTNTRSRSSHFGARKLSHASNCRNTRFKAKTLVFQGIKPDENGNNQAIPSVINEAYFVRPEIREVNPLLSHLTF